MTPQELKQQLALMTGEQVHDLLRKIITKTGNRLKQELAGENEELLDRGLRSYRAKVVRCSVKAAQKWCKWSNEGPVLMPDYTRLYYRKGNTEVIIQEFPPQVRLLKFKGSLVSRETSTTPIMADESNRVVNLSLALPYVVFIFKFTDGKFVDVRCAFCDRPLKRLDEKPLRPYLSNIDNTLMVCLGPSLNRSLLEQGNLTQQVALVLDNFWQTVYTEEWSTHFWSSRTHFLRNNDKRMTTLANWQVASGDNPLFVVENVNWLPYEGVNGEDKFGDIVCRLVEGDRNVQQFQEELYESCSQVFLDEVKKTIEGNVGVVSQRIIDQVADQIIAEAMQE